MALKGSSFAPESFGQESEWGCQKATTTVSGVAQCSLGQINTSSLAVMVHCSKRLVWQPFEHVTCHLTNVSLLSVLANLQMS